MNKKQLDAIGESLTKERVASEFGIDIEKLKDIQLLCAFDMTEDMGQVDIFVLFIDRGKMYGVWGACCSCFDLEGQWEPEETSWEHLKKLYKRHKELSLFLDALQKEKEMPGPSRSGD